MITGLERFVVALRGAGIAASPAEWVEALRAMQAVGLEQRERVRVALRATLAKRAEQQPLFDRVFDEFFASPSRAGTAGPRSRRGREGERPGESRAGDRSPAPSIRPASHEHRDRKRDNELRRALDATRRGDPQRRKRLRHVVISKREIGSDPDHPGLHRSRPVAAPRQSGPFHRELRPPLGVEEEREIAALIPRLVEQIRLRSGRRLRRAPRGRLYLRRLFRANLSHGGVPWVLPRRTVRPRRTRVVLLIDVSWSTARAAGLFLALAGEFLERVGRTRVLLFVDRAVDATGEIQRWWNRTATAPDAPCAVASRFERPGAGIVRGGLSFAALLESLPRLSLEAPSDYGRAFHGLLGSALRPAGRDTALVVLGDGRTNRFDPQAWCFEEIAERCGAVLWLVPEKVERWGTGDSALDGYLPHVDVAVEARDLAGLERGVAELVRRL